MNAAAVPSRADDRFRATGPADPGPGPVGAAPVTVGPLDILRVLNAAGGALAVQAQLHGRLAQLEWQQEKRRLVGLLVASLLGIASLHGLLLLVGAVAMASGWNTPYRIPAVIAVAALYGFSAALAWNRLRYLQSLSASAFATTRSELAADFALLRSRL